MQLTLRVAEAGTPFDARNDVVQMLGSTLRPPPELPADCKLLVDDIGVNGDGSVRVAQAEEPKSGYKITQILAVKL